MFWLAFIANYPAFPKGKWCMWNSRIVPVGEFVEAWLAEKHVMQMGVGSFDCEWRVNLRKYILDEFCRLASLFHPMPLSIL